jgi:hypothetical protein
MRHIIRFGVIGMLASTSLFAAVNAGDWRPATFGPPMICHEFKIGDAKTLPAASDASYPRAQLVTRTLALLTPETPVIVRMETVRRAVSLGVRDADALQEILGALQARVLDLEAREKSDANAWFDAGYFAASMAEMGDTRTRDVGLAQGCAGYAWLLKALTAAKDQPEMEFAAALATHPAMHKGTEAAHRAHLARAAAGAAKDSLLEQNMKAFCTNWGESYDSLKKKGGTDRDAGGTR